MNVSVVIPVYNAARFVERAVESALIQPETAEVLLVEDGSTDPSLAVCERLAAVHDRVRLLRHPAGANRGAGASRNLGLEAASCPLVAFLDADDFYLPERFSAAIPVLAGNPEVDGVYETVEVHAEDEASWQRWRESGWPERIGLRWDVPAEELFDVLVQGGGGSFHTDGLVVRRSLFAKAGRFDPRFRTAQDTHLWIRMAAVGRLVPGPRDRVVARCLVHADNRVTGRPRAERMEGIRQVWGDLLGWGRANGMTPARLRLLGNRYVAASRGVLTGQSLLRAWRTAYEALAAAVRCCPRPWRLAGFGDLLAEALGIGLVVRRSADWAMQGRRRRSAENAGSAPSIALVIVWFGPWPFWMPAFLLSCRWNPGVEWRIISDSAPPFPLPENVKILPMDLETFNRRATQALGFEVRVEPAYVYKLCDLKIMYGRIFREELRGFDFWGCCDMDIVWGDIRRFVTPALLARCDVITSRPLKIAGHFCLFRNQPEWCDLFRRIPGIEACVTTPQHVATDERDLSELLQGYERSRLRRLWTRHVRRWPVPRVYWGPEWTPRGRYQRQMLQDPALCLRWKMGRVFGAAGEELMYLHFHKLRGEMANRTFDYGESPEEFTVSRAGISIANPAATKTSRER